LWLAVVFGDVAREDAQDGLRRKSTMINTETSFRRISRVRNHRRLKGSLIFHLGVVVRLNFEPRMLSNQPFPTLQLNQGSRRTVRILSGTIDSPIILNTAYPNSMTEDTRSMSPIHLNGFKGRCLFYNSILPMQRSSKVMDLAPIMGCSSILTLVL